MKMYQVTDHATGKVENIEAQSAYIAAQAFQLEGRSVTIIPINPIKGKPEVIVKDHKITTNNPEEGTMKAPFKVGDRVKSIKRNYLGTVKWVKFEPNGVRVNRKRGGSHKWGYVQKVEKGGYTVTVNWDSTPICRLHAMQNAKVLELVASKTQPTNPEEGNKMETKETLFTMTEKQIAYIRDLFKAKKQFMTIDEQESLINKMTGHINGSAVLTTKWASAAITKLKSYNTERSAS